MKYILTLIQVALIVTVLLTSILGCENQYIETVEEIRIRTERCNSKYIMENYEYEFINAAWTIYTLDDCIQFSDSTWAHIDEPSVVVFTDGVRRLECSELRFSDFAIGFKE